MFCVFVFVVTLLLALRLLAHVLRRVDAAWLPNAVGNVAALLLALGPVAVVLLRLVVPGHCPR